MNNKLLGILGLLLIFFLLFTVNWLTPLSFGDDYLYAFIWQGHSMFLPITEGAVRISSWNDLLASQKSLFLTWGGRVIGQTLTQFFVWKGKEVFNIVNAFVGLVLMAEIYWCSNKGKVSFNFSPGMICWIFFALWSFAPGFSDVFFWLTCSCIYLWPAMFLLCFLIPYVQKFYNFSKVISHNRLFSSSMFLLGIVAGCGNENSVCWIIIVLCVFLVSYRKYDGKETWMYTGMAGMIFGYALLMLAPGNMARMTGEHGIAWFNADVLNHHFSILLVVFLFQAFLWYFSIRSLYSMGKAYEREQQLRQDVIFVKTLLFVSFGMSATMMFSPEFPTRSGFPGTVPLIIATVILFRLQQEYHFVFIAKSAKTFLKGIAAVYFLMTVSVTLFNFYEKNIYMKEILSTVSQMKTSSVSEVIHVKPFRKVSFTENLASGLHIPNYDLTEEENSWGNVAFSRYYGIKGIKAVE